MLGRTLVVCLVIVLCAGRAGATSRGSGLFVGGAPLPVASSTVDIDVRLGVAHGTVTQRFHNGRPEAVEAVYVFPLPPGAAIETMSARFAGTTVRGVIARRAEAAAAYQEAVAAGRAAALTEQERPGLFTQSLAPIPAGGDVEITLTWRAVLPRRGGQWELAHPLVVGPRYVPGAATGQPTVGSGTSVDTDRAPDASRLTPGASPNARTPYQVTLQLDDATAIASPTHPLAMVARGDAATITVADGTGDRELVVRWASSHPDQVRALVEPAGGGAYVALLVEPAPAPAAPRRAGRRWVLAIDRSPSQAGAGAAIARAVGHAFVAAMPPGDTVAIVTLGAAPTQFDGGDRAALNRAIDVLPTGSGDLTRSLAITLGRLPRDPAPEVVIVTDGLVADDAAAIERAATAGVAVHTIGIGAAPNRWLLAAIASRTGGVTGVVSSIDDVEPVVAAAIATDRAAPVTVDWRTPAVIDTEASAPRVGPGGAALYVAVDPGGIPSGEVEISLGGRKLRARLERRDGAALAATWATLRVARLFAAGDRAGATALALERGIVTPTTALLATTTRASEPVRSIIAVQVPLPVGTRLDSLRDETVRDFDDEGAKDFASPPRPDPQPTGGSGRGGGSEAGGEAGGDRDAPTVARPPAPTMATEIDAAGTAVGDDDGDRGYASVEPSRAADAEDVFTADGGARRSVTVVGLALGVRLDAEVPAAVIDVGRYWPLPRLFAIGVRVTGIAAPVDADPLAATATVGAVTTARLPVRLSFGIGVGWSDGLGAAYDLGVVIGKRGLGLALRFTALAGPAHASTASAGIEAAF